MKQIVFATLLTLSVIQVSAQLSDEYKNQWNDGMAAPGEDKWGGGFLK